MDGGQQSISFGRVTKHRPIEERDIPVFFRGYQDGSFRENDLSPPGLDQDGFSKHLTKLVVETGDAATIVGEADSLGECPIALALFWRRWHVYEIREMIWMPWATPRQILAATETMWRGFIFDGAKLIEWVHPKDEKYFEKLSRTGVMKKVGLVTGIYPDGADAILYQSIGAEEV